MFYCCFRKGYYCLNKIPNYTVKAIVIPYSFNFRVFLSEDLLIKYVSSWFLKIQLILLKVFPSL